MKKIKIKPLQKTQKLRSLIRTWGDVYIPLMRDHPWVYARSYKWKVIKKKRTRKEVRLNMKDEVQVIEIL